MTTGTEALARRAYHLAEDDVLDVQGFIDLFAEDGVLSGIGGVSGPESYRVQHLGDVVVFMDKFLPDVHPGTAPGQRARDVLAIELSIRGAFLGPFETPARDPADGGQHRLPHRRLLVRGRRQDPGVQLPHRCGHDVRAAGRAAGIHLRSRGVRAER